MVSYKQMPDRYNKTVQLPRQLSSLRVWNDRARNTNAAAWIVRVESFIVRSAPQGGDDADRAFMHINLIRDTRFVIRRCTPKACRN
jgi:hypothetical protein